MPYTVDTNGETQYLLVLDTETGGFKPTKHCLLSIGYIVVDRIWRTKEKGEILVRNSRLYCTKEALKINGINLVKHNRKALSEAQAITELNSIMPSIGQRPRIVK